MAIAVIAVLISVLLPALSGAREVARGGVCMSATRQIGASLWMYEGANRGFIPREGTMGSTAQTLRDAIPWNVALRPYLDDRCSPGTDINDMFESAPYYRCPSHLKEPHRVHFVANGFAFVAPGQPDERGVDDPRYRRGPMGSWLIPSPAGMLYLTDLADDAQSEMYDVWVRLGDCDLSIGQCYDAWWSKHITQGSDDFRIGPRRHGRSATAMFLDGHAVQKGDEFFMNVCSWDDGFYAR